MVSFLPDDVRVPHTTTEADLLTPCVVKTQTLAIH